ncbi:hypothetical protein THO17_28390 [Marinomonas sp. THO17]
MFNWFSVSMTKKVGGLAFILLSFLFVVILYSAIQSQRIYWNMKEVAEIDIPLLEVIADIEMLQLKQDLLVESLRLQQRQATAPVIRFSRASITDIEASFLRFSQGLTEQLEKAEKILLNALALGNIRLHIEQHQTLMEQIRKLHKHRLAYEYAIMPVFQQSSIELAAWRDIEDQDNQLEAETDRLLIMIDKLVMSVSNKVEEQEQHFVVVNAILGMSAFAIGLYLTLYIIVSFRRRVWSLRGKIQHLHRAISIDPEQGAQRQYGKDELDELEKDLQTLMGRLSSELDSRQQVESRLIELATRDKLTGAFNLHKWDEQIQQVFALAEQGYQFAMLLIDVDHFKKINDTYGHDIGDQVLKKLVAALNSKLHSPRDSVFRLGGEEFVVLMRQADLTSAAKKAEELRQYIAQLKVENLPKITISLGVTAIQAGDDSKSIVKRADRLLYEAKGAGRNQVMTG